MDGGIRSEARAFEVGRVHALVAPSVGRPHIAIPFDSLATAAPQRLVPGALSDALYFGAIVVVADEAAAIGVFHIKVAFMATDAMERRGSLQVGEECGEIG
jgi:hypothetical protein